MSSFYVSDEKITDQINTEQKSSKENYNLLSNIGEVQAKIASVVAVISSFDLEYIETGDEIIATLKDDLEKKLHALSFNKDCPVEIKSDISIALSKLMQIFDKNHLDTFRTLTIKPLLKKYYEILAEKNALQNLYEELKIRYESLCEMTDIVVRTFLMDKTGIDALKSQIAALEKQIVLQTEQAYISDSIKEVMIEMGYDLIGNQSVIKRSGKRFRNELFSYEDGTAINVTYDDEGQITMELGGISRSDRIPTLEESEILCKDMVTFCTDFKTFEEKLKEKGITVRTRISMSPPIAEHTTIININDYDITETTPVTVKPLWLSPLQHSSPAGRKFLRVARPPSSGTLFIKAARTIRRTH
jgi:hypothetical protein